MFQTTNQSIWRVLKTVVPKNGLLILENRMKMDDLGVPIFLETSVWVCLKIGYILSKWQFS